MSLIYGLQAKNSSGMQKMYFTKNKTDGVDLTLVGTYKGEDIQIDFDELDRDDVDSLIYLLKR